MANLLHLPARPEKSLIYAVVETPRGSRAKFKYEPKLQAFLYSRTLTQGLTYPYDWGFVPSTVAEDGDPLDVMIIHEATTSPGMVIKCRPIGLLQILQKEGKKQTRNDRVFAVPSETGHEPLWTSVQQFPPGMKKELEHFFLATDALVDKTLKFLGWKAEAMAQREINRHQTSEERDIRLNRS